MTESTVVSLPQHGGVEDPLTEVLRASARELVRRAVEAEVAALLAAYDDGRTESGRRRLVRHGHGPERAILTGIGSVVVRRPKVRDRGGTGEDRSSPVFVASTRRIRRSRSTRSRHSAMISPRRIPVYIPNQQMSRVAGTMTSASMAAHQRGRTSAGVEIHRRTAR